MNKTKIYRYLTQKGVGYSTIKPTVSHELYFSLSADLNKVLTKNGIDLFTIVIVPETELLQWYEIDKPLDFIDDIVE